LTSTAGATVLLTAVAGRVREGRIVGAFLARLTVNSAVQQTSAKEKLESALRAVDACVLQKR